MSTIQTSHAQGARTGDQFLEGLGRAGREVWLRGERISHPLEHPDLRGAALSLARVFDLAPQKPKDHLMVVNLSGRGDKDLASVETFLESKTPKKTK